MCSKHERTHAHASEGSLAPDEIAAMVGLSVGEVSDLLGSDAACSSNQQHGAQESIRDALTCLRRACQAVGHRAPRSDAADGSAADTEVTDSATALLSCLTAELHSAQQELDSSLHALAGSLEGSEQHSALPRMLGSTAMVLAAAQQAEHDLQHQGD